MSKIRKVFVAHADNDYELEVFSLGEDLVRIQIDDCQGLHFIDLDVSTSIAFAKELRKTINYSKPIQY